MLGMIPSSLTHAGWLSEIQECTDGGAPVPFIHFPTLPPSHHIKLESYSPSSADIDCGRSGDGGDGSVSITKKLKHNASERDRRKKMSSLYSSLRCLLPFTDQTKRVSSPATISRALKYIPELQQQVQDLRRKKEGLLTKINAITQHQQMQTIGKTNINHLFSLCSVNWLTETQVLLHLISDKTLKFPLPQIVHSLHQDGLLLLTASSFQSSDSNLFFTLLLQVKPNTHSRVLQDILNNTL